MGGDYQAFGHTQFLTRLWDYGLDIQAAQDAPRFFPDMFGSGIVVEKCIPGTIRQQLIAQGHNINETATPIDGSQAIAINPSIGILSGGSDPRKDGRAIGY